MAEKYVNNYSSTLSASYTAGAGSMTVTSATGLPTLAAGNTTHLTIRDATTKAVKLIVKVTAISGTTLTVTAESSDTNCASGDLIDGSVLTVESLDQVRKDISGSGSGSKPATAKAGDLWFPTDDPVSWRYDGSNWKPRGPTYPCGQVVDPGTWINQNPSGSTDTFTLSTGAGRGTMVKTGGSGTGDITARVKNVIASGSFTLTVAFTQMMIVSTYNQCGVCLTDGTKLIVIGYQVFSNQFRLLASAFNSPTSFNSDYSNLWPVAHNGPLWVRVIEDATHRTMYVSDNGLDFIQIAQTTTTSFFTTTQYGLFTRAGASTAITQLTVVSWSETNP